MPNQILIITGDADDAKVLQAVLAKASDGPYAVERVAQLSDALKRIRAGGIDAILVDLSLPDSKGIDTFDQLFALAPQTPIMTLSAQDDEAQTQNLRHAEAGSA